MLRAGGGDDDGGAEGARGVPAVRRRGGGHGRGERAAGALLPAAVRQEQAQVLLRALPPQPRRALHPRLALAPLPSPIQPCHLAIELARLAN